jgi:hypothetical protein
VDGVFTTLNASRVRPSHLTTFRREARCLPLGPIGGNTSFPIMLIGNTAGTSRPQHSQLLFHSLCHFVTIPRSCNSALRVRCPLLFMYFHLLIAYSAILTGSAFPGSSVLVQDSLGVRASSEHLPSLLTIMTHQHTSFSATSLCTQQHVAAYLLNGTLPTNGTVCPVDISLFPSANDTATTTRRNWLTRRRV